MKHEKGNPIAYYYELATTLDSDGAYGTFEQRLGFDKPNVPEGAVRNLTALVKVKHEKGKQDG